LELAPAPPRGNLRARSGDLLQIEIGDDEAGLVVIEPRQHLSPRIDNH
jgi:hypothetical protein